MTAQNTYPAGFLSSSQLVDPHQTQSVIASITI